MPLSESEIEEIQSNIDEINELIDSELDLIRNNTHASVLGLNTATEIIKNSKKTIEAKLQYIKNKINVFDANIDEIVTSTRDIQKTIASKEKYGSDQKYKESEAKTLYDLRKDQSDTLKKKNNGNYHSSWLGLWKPLTEEGQVGLLILSIVFGVLSCISIFFLIRENFSKIIPASLRSQSTSITKQLTGGFINISKKKNK